MKVAKILHDKGGDLASVTPDHPILEVVGMLAERGIGAVLVLDDNGALVGILSERDIVRALVKKGADLSTMTAADLMTKKVTVCDPNHDVNYVMKQMTNGAFRHVPVKDGDRLVGIISIGDVVRARIDELENETAYLQHYIAG